MESFSLAPLSNIVVRYNVTCLPIFSVANVVETAMSLMDHTVTL